MVVPAIIGGGLAALGSFFGNRENASATRDASQAQVDINNRNLQFLDTKLNEIGPTRPEFDAFRTGSAQAGTNAAGLASEALGDPNQIPGGPNLINFQADQAAQDALVNKNIIQPSLNAGFEHNIRQFGGSTGLNDANAANASRLQGLNLIGSDPAARDALDKAHTQFITNAVNTANLGRNAALSSPQESERQAVFGGGFPSVANQQAQIFPPNNDLSGLFGVGSDIFGAIAANDAAVQGQANTDRILALLANRQLGNQAAAPVVSTPGVQSPGPIINDDYFRGF